MTGGSVNGTGVGVGLSLIFTAQTFPFMLSSAFTARTIVRQKGQQESVMVDAWIATGISVAFAFLLAYFMHDWIVGLVGSVFAIVVFMIYLERGELL